MKVKASVRSLARKDGSYVVRRRGHLYVINKKNPHWKARQGWWHCPSTRRPEQTRIRAEPTGRPRCLSWPRSERLKAKWFRFRRIWPQPYERGI